MAPDCGRVITNKEGWQIVISTFLLGYAVAQGAEAVEAAAKISLLASNWPAKE